MWSGWSTAAAVLFSALVAPSALRAADSHGIRIEAGFTADSNVTRASGDDKLSDRSFSIDVSKNLLIPVSEHTRLSMAGFLGGERFLSHKGLSRDYYGIHAEYQYRASGDFGAPTFAIFGRASADQYASYLRDGYRYSAGATVRKSLTDRIDFFGALARNVRDAKNAVFDDKDYSARANLDYALGRGSTLYVGGEYRRGDIVSTARPAFTKLDDHADAEVRDDVFTDTVRNSYRVRANTILTTVGCNFAFGEGQALDFSWRWVQSTPTVNAVSTRYFDNQFTVAYLIRF